jgi:hypothetical protein
MDILRNNYDTRTAKRKSGSGAQFIVLELIDTFDSKATDDAQIEEALRVLDRAATDLLGVMKALEER